MATRIAQTDLARDALYTKVNQMYDEKVSLTGNETIRGVKTFTSDLWLYNSNPVLYHRQPNFNKGDIPQANITSNNTFVDDTGNLQSSTVLASYGSAIFTNGSTRAHITAYRNVAGSTDNASIFVSYPIDGDPYTYAPTPTDTTSTSSNQIVTVGFMNSLNNNVVHKTGDETIAGYKTFSRAVSVRNQMYVQHADDDRQTAPSQNKYAGFAIVDSNNERMTIFEKTHRTNGEITASMLVSRQGTTGTENQIGISVIYPPSGNGYATCPTPTDTTQTNSNQIATVGWANSTNNNLVHKSGDETIAGTKKFSTSPIIPTPGVSSNTTVPASTAYVNSKLVKVSTLPASPNSDVYYFIPE